MEAQPAQPTEHSPSPRLALSPPMFVLASLGLALCLFGLAVAIGAIGSTVHLSNWMVAAVATIALILAVRLGEDIYCVLSRHSHRHSPS